MASLIPEKRGGFTESLPPVQVAQGILSLEFIQAAMHRLWVVAVFGRGVQEGELFQMGFNLRSRLANLGHSCNSLFGQARSSVLSGRRIYVKTHLACMQSIFTSAGEASWVSTLARVKAAVSAGRADVPKASFWGQGRNASHSPLGQAVLQPEDSAACRCGGA